MKSSSRDTSLSRSSFLPKILADRLHQMRFAQPDAAVNEEWVVVRAALVPRQTGGVRDLVVGSDDERFKGVSRIKTKPRPTVCCDGPSVLRTSGAVKSFIAV